MKKVLYILIAVAALSTALFYASSCKKLLSKDVEISDELIFSIGGSGSVEAEDGQEQVLYKGDLEIDLYSEFEKAGISKNLIKSFILNKGRIEVLSPKDFDLSLLDTVKLYLGEKSNLVAISSGVENGVLRFNIQNPELFKKLEGEKLHIIITGTKPVGEVQLKLVTDYVAQVSLF